MVLKQQQQQQSNAREPTRVSADRNEELEETIVKLKTTLDEAKYDLATNRDRIIHFSICFFSYSISISETKYKV